MAHRVCPVWIGYLLLSPLRKLLQNPEKILAGMLQQGMTVLDIGPGMGFFSIPMARMVGRNGKVICVDMQEGMLKVLRKRATRAGVAGQIGARLCGQNTLGLQDCGGKVDFALAFAMVHETPNAEELLMETAAALKPAGRLLVAEPRGHVKEPDFEATVSLAERCGFQVIARPKIWRSRAVLLTKSLETLAK